MDVRRPWGLYLALATTSALTVLPHGCTEEAGSTDDGDTDGDTEADGCPAGFPVDCEDGLCCPEGTLCVVEGCCAEATPINCGFGVCAASEADCADLGMGFPPCGGLGSCPEQEMYCLAEGPGFVCLPPCEVTEDCPMPGVCAYNPMSSVQDCQADGMCSDEQETCTDNAAGGRTCLLPASHCVPLCDLLADCPAGLDCVDGVCLFFNPDD